MKTALIIENCQLTAKAFKNILEKAYEGIEISLCADYQSANCYLLHEKTDIALIDIHFPDDNGLDIIPPLLKLNPESHVVVISMIDADRYILQTIKKGANSYLITGLSEKFFIQKIKAISDAGSPLSPSVTQTLLHYIHHPETLIKTDCVVKNPYNLTHREKEVLTIIAKGYNRKETSHFLTVSESTIATHIHNIYSKLNISCRSEATLEACKMNLLNPDNLGSG
jgi:DNA-binding NarL/FixJ family response regulator